MEALLKIYAELKRELSIYESELSVRMDIGSRYELWSEKEVFIDGRKKKEVYFASLIVQSSYVGFYFMPVYSDAEIKKLFSAPLLKLLKGKSCFHIKKLDENLKEDIKKALREGFLLYKNKGWI